MANKQGDKQTHLTLIQGVIDRMAGNLFYLRGWSIALIAGVIALLSKQNDPRIFAYILIILVTLLFWIYDGYFLSMERKYRKLYDKVSKLSDENIDYSMDTREFNKLRTTSIIFCMFSKTLWPFYTILLLASSYLIVSSII